MTTVMIIAIIIVLIVLLLSVLTTSKAYKYKHTVDPIEDNPHFKTDGDPENSSEKTKRGPDH